VTEWLRTGIGASTADSITVRGRDLATELMGRVSFTELAFLLVSGRAPTAEQARMLDVVLVSLADHGLTPTVLAARLTYAGAPESLQGSVAAGLLGAGTVFLGVVEDTAAYLARILERVGPEPSGAALRAAAEEAVHESVAAGRRVPGLGHPVHKVEDPRTPRMYEIAQETGQLGPHLRRRAGRCRSTAPASPAPRSPTSASRPPSCGASPWSPGRRASSATWRRRWPTRSACRSTARWTSGPSTSPRPPTPARTPPEQ
jgi:hypothetical protein